MSFDKFTKTFATVWVGLLAATGVAVFGVSLVGSPSLFSGAGPTLAVFAFMASLLSVSVSVLITSHSDSKNMRDTIMYFLKVFTLAQMTIVVVIALSVAAVLLAKFGYEHTVLSVALFSVSATSVLAIIVSDELVYRQ